jgi:hypothetical protein
MTALYPNPHPPNCPWHESANLLGAPNIKWCEAPVCGWISEPANTWSNLAFLLFALVIYQQCRNSPHAELRWMGPAMFFMGLCSGLYHASNNYLSQMADFIGMYLLIFWFLAINLRRSGWITLARQHQAFIALVLFGVALVHLMYLAQLRFQLIIAVASVAVLATEFSARRHSAIERVSLRWFWASLALLVLAQSASLADLTRLLCDPDNHFIQGHALWHLLSACALFCSVQHYRQLRYDARLGLN